MCYNLRAITYDLIGPTIGPVIPTHALGIFRIVLGFHVHGVLHVSGGVYGVQSCTITILSAQQVGESAQIALQSRLN